MNFFKPPASFHDIPLLLLHYLPKGILESFPGDCMCDLASHYDIMELIAEIKEEGKARMYDWFVVWTGKVCIHDEHKERVSLLNETWKKAWIQF